MPYRGRARARGIGTLNQRSWTTRYTNSDDVLFFGEVSKIADGKLYNQKTGAADYLTVTGSAGSYTFQCPNTAPYIAADTDYIWFKTDETQRTTTTAELIGYDFTRTIVKYGNVTPNAITAIMILSSDVDTARMRNDFDLSIWWSNVLSDYGNTKDNRGAEKSVWTAESVHEAEVLTYIEGLTTPLSEGQLTKLDTLVAAIKTGLSIESLDAAFDYMYILAGETAESALRNIVKRAHDGTPQGSPTFAALEGYTGGTNKYIDTNYNAHTQKVNFLQSNCSMGCYSRSDILENAVEMGTYISSNGTYLMYKYGNGKRYCAFNSGEGERGLVLTPTTGMLIGVRNSETSEKYYLNGVLKDDLTAAGTAPKNLNDYLLGYNNNGTAGAFSTKQNSFYFKAKALTVDEVVVITNAIEAYMDSNGKGVIA